MKPERESRDRWKQERQVDESLGKSQWKEKLLKAGQEIITPDGENLQDLDKFFFSI